MEFESICLSPPMGIGCAPADGHAIHKHSDETWWFWDETWCNEYGPYTSYEEVVLQCHEYAMSL